MPREPCVGSCGHFTSNSHRCHICHQSHTYTFIIIIQLQLVPCAWIYSALCLRYFLGNGMLDRFLFWAQILKINFSAENLILYRFLWCRVLLVLKTGVVLLNIIYLAMEFVGNILFQLKAEKCVICKSRFLFFVPVICL